MMKPTGKILLYGIYTLFAAGILFYLRFPSDIVRDMIVAKLARTQPNIQLRIQGAHPIFPPGIKLEPLSVAYADIPIANMDFIEIIPGLLSIMSNQKEFALNGPLNGGGTLKGHAEIVTDNPQPQLKCTFNIAGVPVEMLELVKKYPDYKPSGALTAYVDYDSRKGIGGTANIKMDIAPAKLTLAAPLMGIDQLEFSQVQMEMTVTPRMLQIKRCEASGMQLESKVTGTIVFRQPLQDSRLTLSCTLKPQAGFAAEHKNDMLGGLFATEAAQKRGVLFRITGSLGNPSYVIR